MSGENYRSVTKSHEPGWNDPPKLSYSPTGTGPGQSTKLNLNKRVVFPVAHGTATAAQSPLTSGGGSSLPQFLPAVSGPLLNATDQMGPPQPAKLSGSPMPPQVTSTPPRSNVSGRQQLVPNQETAGYPEDKEMMNFVKVTLEDVVLKLDDTKQAEILKRLEMIQQNWSDGKLGEELAKKLYRLAKAFTEARASEANKIHRSIIVDHGSVCVQWAPALRQLVLLIPKQQESTAAGNGVLKPIE